MGVELKIIIGHTWGWEETEAFKEFHTTYGRGIHEIARFDLSGVDDSIWKLVYKYQAEADTEFEATGAHYIIYTDVAIEDDEGQWQEHNLHEDKYGKKIAAIPLEELLATIKLAQTNATAPGGNWAGRGYRRYAIAIVLIEQILAHFDFEAQNTNNKLVALTYGH